jgi:hypothetical protein
VLTLTDVTDTKNKPHVIAGAVAGVTGLKKVIYNTIVAVTGRKMATFDTIGQARDWLAGQ